MALKGIVHEIISDYKRVAAEKGSAPSRDDYVGTKHKPPLGKYSKREICDVFGSWARLVLAVGGEIVESENPTPIRVLIFDIETAPMIVYTYGLFDQTHGPGQIIQHGYVLSWCAMWSDGDEIIYRDLRAQRGKQNDREICLELRELLDQADVVVTQNGIKFDQKVMNDRFFSLGINRPSTYRHIDTLRIAKKHFAFPSNSLEYMCMRFNVKYQKLKHGKFPGMQLQIQCMAANQEAWDEMEKYNKNDVLALKELRNKMVAYDDTVNYNVFHDGLHTICKCGGQYKQHAKKPYWHSNGGRYQRFQCVECGSEMRGKTNLLSPKKKASLKHYTPR